MKCLSRKGCSLIPLSQHSRAFFGIAKFLILLATYLPWRWKNKPEMLSKFMPFIFLAALFVMHSTTSSLIDVHLLCKRRVEVILTMEEALILQKQLRNPRKK